jgi:L-rhamnose mutarotase
MRKAFVMSVNAGAVEEYRRRHSPIWPELEAVLKAHGVHNYSIFFFEKTHQLFAYAEIESQAHWADIAATPVCRRWWDSMATLMPHNADSSPLADDLVEVFHLD